MGVKGISDRSSFGPKSGYNAMRMFMTKKSRNTRREISGYVWRLKSFCNRKALESVSTTPAPAAQLTHYDLKLSPIKTVAKSAVPFHRSFFRLRSLNVAAF